MARAFRHLRTNAVGYLALFVALSAGAYAAVAPRNSVVSKSIKNHEVKNRDLALNSVRGANVTDDTLAGDDIAEAALNLDTMDLRRAGANAYYIQRSCPSAGTPQSIPSGADTKILYLGAHSSFGLNNGTFTSPIPTNCADPETGVVTVHRDGFYLIAAGARWAANPTGSRFIGIQATTVGTVAGDRRQAVTGLPTDQTATTVVPLFDGDKVQVVAFQDSGAPLSLLNDDRRTFLSLVMLGHL